MERKSSTEYSVVFLGKQKVQVTFKGFIFVVGSMLRNGLAQRLSSQYFTAVLISNIAELVPSGFFCPQPWFLRWSEHISPRKTPVFIVINTVTCVTRVTSNQVEVHCLNSQHFAITRFFVVGFAGKRFLSSLPLPVARTFLRSPQFSCIEKVKNASNLRKALYYGNASYAG